MKIEDMDNVGKRSRKENHWKANRSYLPCRRRWKERDIRSGGGFSY